MHACSSEKKKKTMTIFTEQVFDVYTQMQHIIGLCNTGKH